MDKAPDTAWQGPAMRKLVSKSAFERYHRGEHVRAERIIYQSDHLKIKGFLLTPKSCDKPCPVLIYSQGGAGEWSRITFFDILEMHRLAEKGYVVISTTRRGEGGSEGKPNLGAGDLADTLALIDIADGLPGTDPSRIHYLGFSRGAALGYRVLAATDRVKSAVMIGGPSDSVRSPRRAEFHEFVYPGMVDHYEENQDAALRALSALYWPEKISETTRLLLLHGATDKRVIPDNSLKLAERLLMLDRPVRMVLFENGSHSLIEHYPLVRGEIDRWFAP
jgi:dipeptidyl aminopeptidase/acylaminoacyl peptidase